MKFADIAKFEEHQIIRLLLSLVSDSPKIMIDIGGNVSADISTPFIKSGWRTLIVEPQSSCVDKLRDKFADYPNAKVVQSACSFEVDRLKLFVGKDGAFSEVSTFETRSDPWMDVMRSRNYQEVDVVPLSFIWEREHFPRRIGILKVDTESWDYNVFRGLDFDRFEVDVIVTEEYYWKADDTINKHVLLEDAGYVNIGFVGYNTVWVHRRLGARHCHVAMRPWLTAIGRFPKSLGVPDVTSASAVLEPELFTRPLEKSDCLTVLAPQVDVMVANSQEAFEVTILNLTAEHCQADGEVYYRWIKWDGRIAVPGTGTVAIETAIAPAAAVRIALNLRAPATLGLHILEVGVTGRKGAAATGLDTIGARQPIMILAEAEAVEDGARQVVVVDM